MKGEWQEPAPGSLRGRWFAFRYGWWWWHVSRHLHRDQVERRLANWIPRGIALWCYIRVTANWDGSPGRDYRHIYDAWVNPQPPRVPHLGTQETTNCFYYQVPIGMRFVGVTSANGVYGPLFERRDSPVFPK